MLTRLQPALRRRALVWALNALGVVAATVLVAPQVEACFGTPRPPACSRSTRLIKTSPAIVVLPATPAPVTVLVRTSVFISLSGSCAPPLATTFTLTAACAPPGMGTVTTPTPASGTFSIFVPVTFPAGPARTCTVTGTATTTFADGVTLTATGDTVICLVDPAPGDPSKPRLDMELLTPDLQTAHAGDQVVDRYRITNNDPNEACTIMIAADSEQTAKIPTATGILPGVGDGVFAIADPGAGDNFPIAFLEDLVPDPGPGNNYFVDDSEQEQAVGQNVEGSIVWLNAFTAVPGAEVIDKISVAFGPGADGKRYSVLLYEDPTDDGDPTDAVLLTRTDAIAAGGGTDTFNEVKIVPTFVGTAGETYYAGVVMQELDADDLVAAQDTSSDAGVSWVAAGLSTCIVDVNDLTNNDIPLDLIANFGFPGNWMIRANGTVPQVAPWVTLPADPPGFGIPTITRTLRLCPGESREVEIASRSWLGCPSGSACEKRIVITGTFDDGTPALACGGTAHAVDNSIPPNYDCPDGGMHALVHPKPAGVVLESHLPTHDINECLQLVEWNVLSEGAVGPLLTEPLATQLLSEEQGRVVLSSFDPNGGPAAQPGLPFEVNLVIRSMSKMPFVQTELQELMLVGASPGLGDTYFSFKSRAGVAGPAIPPTLDSFLEGMFQVSVDGLGAGQHVPAQIDQGSIQVEILDPAHLLVNFVGFFPEGPPQFERLDVLVDMAGAAGGLSVEPSPLPCPGDIDVSGTIGFGDLLAVLSAWGPCPGCPEDIDGDDEVGFADLLHVLSNWGPCD